MAAGDGREGGSPRGSRGPATTLAPSAAPDPAPPRSPYRRWLISGEAAPSDERRASAARVARKLAALYRALGRTDDARALYRRALALAEGTLEEAELRRLLAEL